jgi:hypothetical protein
VAHLVEDSHKVDTHDVARTLAIQTLPYKGLALQEVCDSGSASTEAVLTRSNKVLGLQKFGKVGNDNSLHYIASNTRQTDWPVRTRSISIAFALVKGVDLGQLPVLGNTALK